MKRTVILALALVLLFCCAGCGEDVKVIQKDDPGLNKVTVGPEGSVDGYIFETGGLKVAVDADMAPVLEALGDPDQYYEAASCAFEGLDKMYTYAHFEVDSYPTADGDRVLAVFLMDDLVTTPEGLRLGDPQSRAEELYGKSYELVGKEMVYSKGGMKLKILLEDDLVSYISYCSTVADAG